METIRTMGLMRTMKTMETTRGRIANKKDNKIDNNNEDNRWFKTKVAGLLRMIRSDRNYGRQ